MFLQVVDMLGMKCTLAYGKDMGPSLQVLLLSVVAEGGDAGEPANISWEQNRL